MNNDLREQANVFETNQSCAIYARYSSDLQRPTSIEDQIRKCRQACVKNQGWTIVEEWVVADREVSGTSLNDRDALNALKEAATRRVRPFDVILIDDTSRFGRNLGDVLKLSDWFEHYGVSLQFVSPPLDSRNPNFRHLLIFKGMMDEGYSRDLAEKVRRGHEGQVLRGYNAGSACYGYKNVTVTSSSGKGDGIEGVRLEIIPEQAEVVRRMFAMYGSNDFSLDQIAKKLRSEGVPAPRPPRRNSVRGWSPDGIASMLRNKKYIGINEWRRTINSKHPETGRVVTRERPEHEWIRCEKPEWRIVSDESWERVQRQLEFKKRFGVSKAGGLGRTTKSQTYLFSGLLVCGLCGGPVNIVDGTAGGVTVWYGCAARRSKGTCSNDRKIRRDSLETQILSWLTKDLLDGDRLEMAFCSLSSRVEERVSELAAEARREATQSQELRKELTLRRQEARTIGDVIVEMAVLGQIPSKELRSRLLEADQRVKQIEDILAQTVQVPSPAFAPEAIKEQFMDWLRGLPTVLASSPLIARQFLRKYIKKITLTPASEKRRLNAVVEFESGNSNSGVLPTVKGGPYLQQYGLPPLTLAGLELKSYVRAKRNSNSLSVATNEAPDSNHVVADEAETSQDAADKTLCPA